METLFEQFIRERKYFRNLADTTLYCPAPICYPNQIARDQLFSIFDLNSRGVKYPKLECGLCSL
jgi:hypothetical protein